MLGLGPQRDAIRRGYDLLVRGAAVAGMLISTPPDRLLLAVVYGLGLVGGAGASVVTFGVDAATGSWYRLLPGEVMVGFDD